MFSQTNLPWDQYASLDKEGHNAAAEPILKITVQRLENEHLPKIAIDLGAGKGRDTKFLLDKGFKVIAVEENRQSVISLNQLKTDQLQVVDDSFSNIDTTEFSEPFSLINASYSLPYAGDRGVKNTLHKMSDKLILGGRFSGQFFGARCSFVTADPTNVAAHTKDEIVKLFSSCHLTVETCLVEQGVGQRMDGVPYEKDFLHVIARKNTSLFQRQKMLLWEKIHDFSTAFESVGSCNRRTLFFRNENIGYDKAGIWRLEFLGYKNNLFSVSAWVCTQTHYDVLMMKLHMDKKRIPPRNKNREIYAEFSLGQPKKFDDFIDMVLSLSEFDAPTLSEIFTEMREEMQTICKSTSSIRPQN